MDIWGYKIISVSQQPLGFGENIVLDVKRGVLSIFRQILAGLEHSKADAVFLLEHDILYHPSHFDFTPAEDNRFYYDRNRWAVCPDTGKAVFYHTNVPSLLCANRELLLDHYSKCVKYTEENGYSGKLGYSPPKGIPKEMRQGRHKAYFSEYPSLDVRHGKTFTRKRMTKDQFRNERGCRGWTEAYSVDGWGDIKELFEGILRC